MRRDDASPPQAAASEAPAPGGLATTVLSTSLAQPQLIPLLHAPPAVTGLALQAAAGSTSIFPQAPTLVTQQLPSTLAPHAPFYFGPGVQPSFPLPQPTLYQRIQMQIAVQPPAKTVYQRILKPFPSVYLILPPLHNHVSSDPLGLLYDALNAKSHEEGVFVEVSVVRNDNGDSLDRSIDGQTTARLEKSGWNSGVYTATFKKLKLLTTSQQRSGTKFSLCFRLKCNSLALGSLADMVVISNPIEVFSHSQYLGKAEGPEDARAKSQPGTLKYADNPAGLHLKLMESIHAFKELGGAQETLLNYISAIYNQNNPIPSAFFAFAPTSSMQQPQQLPDGFLFQAQQLPHQHILPAIPFGAERASPTAMMPSVYASSSQPSFPLTPSARRSSTPSSMGSSPPSSPSSSLPAAQQATTPPTNPPRPRPSPTTFAPLVSVPMTPQTGASFLPSIASLLAPQDMTHLPSTTQPSHLLPVSSGRQASSVEAQDNPLPGSGRGSSLLSSLLLGPLQALSQACHEETGKRKEIQDDSGLARVRQPTDESEDIGEKEPRQRKRRRKSAD